MSLEKALAENTAAILALTAALQNGAPVTTSAPASESAPAKTETKKTETKKADSPSETKGDEIPYETVKNKTLELVKAKGRDSVTTLLKDFGKDVASAKDLKADQYADYLKKVDAILAEDDVA